MECDTPLVNPLRPPSMSILTSTQFFNTPEWVNVARYLRNLRNMSAKGIAAPCSATGGRNVGSLGWYSWTKVVSFFCFVGMSNPGGGGSVQRTQEGLSVLQKEHSWRQ